jgi:ferredoxin
MMVFVDDDSCAGHGACASVCPSVFAITDDGYAEATDAEIPAELEAAVVGAADSCPERAIRLV